MFKPELVTVSERDGLWIVGGTLVSCIGITCHSELMANVVSGAILHAYKEGKRDAKETLRTKLEL